MAGMNDRYSVGNIIAVLLVMMFSAGMVVYAIFNDSTDRIGRNWQFVVVLGVLGVLWTGWTAIKGIRSRRR